MDQASHITLISEEDKPGYYRPLITHLIHDHFPEERFLRDPSLFADLKVEVLSPAKAESVDLERKKVRTSRDHVVPYDKLLLATGSIPLLPQIKGANNEDFHTLRFYQDGVKIAGEAQSGKKALIVGGGRIGILTALALREANLEVTVVEMLGHVLPQQLDAAAAAIVSPAIEAKGIRLLMGHQVKEIEHKPSKDTVAILDDGRELPFDLLVAAVGVRPNLELAQQMGIKVASGVVVDEFMQTSLPDVFAAGDIVQLVDRATGQEFV
ncbi:MAG: NAD(P)/FAD-dependent oxidoreductase, partial [Dehalococcoidia bacterium]